MLTRLVELKELGLTWTRIAEKLAYEDPKWKVSRKTVTKIYARIQLGTQTRAA